MELPGGAFKDPDEQAVSEPVRWDRGIAALRGPWWGHCVVRAEHHWSTAKRFWWKGRRLRDSETDSSYPLRCLPPKSQQS